MMISSVMAATLGYDEFGNNPDLLAVVDAKALEDGTWNRASQDVVCQTCGLFYRQHPTVQGALWLRRTCEGLVKL